LRKTTTTSRGKRSCIKKTIAMPRERRRSIKRVTTIAPKTKRKNITERSGNSIEH